MPCPVTVVVECFAQCGEEVELFWLPPLVLAPISMYIASDMTRLHDANLEET